MIGPIIWLAIAFAALLLVRVCWVLILQPKPMTGRKPVDSADGPEVIRWADANTQTGSATDPDEVAP